MCALCTLTACSAPSTPKAPPGTTSPVTLEAPDPTESIYFSWAPIDEAIQTGALEHVVVATLRPPGTPEARTYDLLALGDRPGTLEIRRADDGGELRPGARSLTITARIGRFGDPDLESAVVTSIRRLLEEATRQALADTD